MPHVGTMRHAATFPDETARISVSTSPEIATTVSANALAPGADRSRAARAGRGRSRDRTPAGRERRIRTVAPSHPCHRA
jgi:hypothetical protein